MIQLISRVVVNFMGLYLEHSTEVKDRATQGCSRSPRHRNLPVLGSRLWLCPLGSTA